MGPMGLGVLGHGDEVVSEVEGFDAGIEVEEGFGEGGTGDEGVILAGEVDSVGVAGVVVVAVEFDLSFLGVRCVFRVGIVAQDEAAVGDEFEAFGIGRGGGLDEEGSSLLLECRQGRRDAGCRDGRWLPLC